METGPGDISHEQAYSCLTRLTEGIQFSLAFCESFRVRGINQEDDAVDLGEVVSP